MINAIWVRMGRFLLVNYRTFIFLQGVAMYQRPSISIWRSQHAMNEHFYPFSVLYVCLFWKPWCKAFRSITIAYPVHVLIVASLAPCCSFVKQTRYSLSIGSRVLPTPSGEPGLIFCKGDAFTINHHRHTIEHVRVVNSAPPELSNLGNHTSGIWFYQRVTYQF